MDAIKRFWRQMFIFRSDSTDGVVSSREITKSGNNVLNEGIVNMKFR